MRTIAPHHLMATVVVAALLGVIAGFSITSQSTAGSLGGFLRLLRRDGLREPHLAVVPAMRAREPATSKKGPAAG